MTIIGHYVAQACVQETVLENYDGSGAMVGYYLSRRREV